jgi:hypothetical protein
MAKMIESEKSLQQVEEPVLEPEPSNGGEHFYEPECEKCGRVYCDHENKY